MYKLDWPYIPQKDKTSVSDILLPDDVEANILSYDIVRIYAKVGSGKNYWANLLIDLKDENGIGLNVLYITSRRGTANAEAVKINANRFVDIEKTKKLDKAIGTAKQIRDYCTHYGIEMFIKKHSIDEVELYCKALDIIVVDEVHSCTTDATFADSPFYVANFMKFAKGVNPDLTIVMMTGTPRPIFWLERFLNSSNLNIKEYDLRHICDHVVTENIHFISKKDADKQILEQIKSHEKFIYFADSVTREQNIWNDLIEKSHIPFTDIGISFSAWDSDSKREGFIPSLPESQKEEITECLMENEALPDSIIGFFTTITNKEGINIKNKDIQTMYVESYWSDEIIQMAGRLRNGVKDLYIVTGHNYRLLGEYDRAIEAKDKYVLPHINKALAEYREEYELLFSEYIEYFTRELDWAFQFFKFDSLQSKQFIEYTGRIAGIHARNASYLAFIKALKCWDIPAINESLYDADGVPIMNDKITGKQYFENLFEESVIHDFSITTGELSEIYSKEERLTQASQVIETLFLEKGWLNTKLSSNIEHEVLDTINNILADYGLKTTSQLKRALRNLGFTIERHGHKGNYISKKTGIASSYFTIKKP